MRLYATVTSERASKGQGGNEYLSIHIRKVGDRDNDAMVITQYASGEIVINHDKDVKVRLDTYTKGKRQKGEVCLTCNSTGWLSKTEKCLNCNPLGVH